MLSILELITDLLDGWQNAQGLASLSSGNPVSQLSDATNAQAIEASLHGINLPSPRPESEAVLRSLPPTYEGGDLPEVSDSWAHWRMPGSPGPAIGLVDVKQADPTCTTGVDLVSSLTVAEVEEFVAGGFIDADEHSFSWVVGVTAGQTDARYVLVLGPNGPVAYVALASDERELHDVIRAIRAATP